MNVYGDAVTVHMEEVHNKIGGLALNSTESQLSN